MKKKLIIIVAVVVLIFGAVYVCQKITSKNVVNQNSINETPNVVPKTDEGIINSVTFGCAENKKIQAIFFKDRVELTLSDGRNMLLSQAVSASGARYANTDESFVFWNKGDTAFVTEGNKNTYNECVIDKSSTD